MALFSLIAAAGALPGNDSIGSSELAQVAPVDEVAPHPPAAAGTIPIGSTDALSLLYPGVGGWEPCACSLD